MPKKHLLPVELQDRITQEAYSHWLQRKAAAHVRRDRKRGHTCTNSVYKDAIHEAVIRSKGFDCYTGEQLDWKLISTYNNEHSKIGKHSYKAKFALLPTVDHIEASSKKASFNVCSWRTNDAKNDLSHQSCIELCMRILQHEGYSIDRKV